MKSISLRSAALFAMLFAASAPAYAKDASPNPSAPPEEPPLPQEPSKPPAWYGGQTLTGVIISDIVMLSAIPFSFSSNVATAFALAGLAGHVLTPPIVHWSHGYDRKGVASFGLMVGGPLVLGSIGLGIGYAIAPRGGGWLGAVPVYAGTLTGLVLGGISATVVDVAVLARESPAAKPQNSRKYKGLSPSSVAVLPIVDKERIGLSLVGQF